jgi:hypothetical protein
MSAAVGSGIQKRAAWMPSQKKSLQSRIFVASPLKRSGNLHHQGDASQASAAKAACISPDPGIAAAMALAAGGS